MAGGVFLCAISFCASAQAQNSAAAISKRIESTFNVVIGNTAELAIPLTRRALAHRFSEGAPGPVVPALAYGAGDEPNATSSIDVPASDAATADDPILEQGSADDPAEVEAARMPRPRPAQEADAVSDEDAMGGPLDLVAGAADPGAEKQLASADAEPSLPPDDPAIAAAVQPASPAHAAAPLAELVASGACLQPDRVTDKDGDFSRNAEVLSLSGFCIEEESFKERRRPWRIQTIKTGRPGPLFAVMHDDENMAFDNAVAALKTYGGTLVAMETGGKRNQDGIDPNRNFSADGIGCSKLGNDATPKFTAVFRALFDPTQPIIALHNNTGKRIPTGGVGHVTMDDVPKDMDAHASSDPKSPLASDTALVLLTSPVPISTTSKAEAADLSAKGINALIEGVREKKGDCSLSNYSLLTGHPSYFNVTVDDDEREKQQKIVDMIMAGRTDTVAAQ